MGIMYTPEMEADAIDNIISRHKGAPRRLNKTQHLKEFKDMLKNGVTINMVKHSQHIEVLRNKNNKFDVSEWGTLLTWMVEEFQGPYACTFVQTDCYDQYGTYRGLTNDPLAHLL